MRFRVRTSAAASLDLEHIFVWLLENGSGEAGLRWFNGLHAAVKSLESMPRRCQIAPESGGLAKEVRQLLYGTRPHTYRLLFTIDDNTVTLVHVRHARRASLKTDWTQ